MNKGILRTALAGKVALELTYSEPSGNGNEVDEWQNPPHESSGSPQFERLLSSI